jgi:hypothetical protein
LIQCAKAINFQKLPCIGNLIIGWKVLFVFDFPIMGEWQIHNLARDPNSILEEIKQKEFPPEVFPVGQLIERERRQQEMIYDEGRRGKNKRRLA